MDPSILRGEQSSSKKAKVSLYEPLMKICFIFQIVHVHCILQQCFLSIFFIFQIEIGLLHGNSQVIFEKAENSSINLIG